VNLFTKCLYLLVVTLQGTTSDMSNPNKLSSAMEKHNLFLYYDHNCGKLIHTIYLFVTSLMALYF